MNIRPALVAACALALAGCVSDGDHYADDGYYGDDHYARSVDRGYDRMERIDDGHDYDRRVEVREYDRSHERAEVRAYDGGADRGYADCHDCGRVERIERLYGNERTTGAGAVTGAVVGGVVGNQVGSGSGRRAATVAGAVIGGIAGNEIEEDSRGGTRYDVYVRMGTGRSIVVSQHELDGIREGSAVRISGGRAYLL